MKSKYDPLDRLLKAAAHAPAGEIPREAPLPIRRAAFSEWRNGSGVMTEDWYTFLPVLRGGLAFACCVALVALVFSYAERDHSPDEVAIIDSVMTLSYLP